MRQDFKHRGHPSGDHQHPGNFRRHQPHLEATTVNLGQNDRLWRFPHLMVSTLQLTLLNFSDVIIPDDKDDGLWIIIDD